jgi:hypothetical protein
MADVSELEAQRLASAFRPNRKPLLIAVLANGVMAVLLLGVPYWRGRHLGSVERQDFAEFARCLMGGEIASEPGLSLPRGERDHFAARVLFAKPTWPLACRPALHKLAPPDAIFLWPSVKEAGADLRAAVDMVDHELLQLDTRRKRGAGRVPERPLAALKRLQAATVLYAHAAGSDSDVDNDAIRFPGAAPGLATPARLPLMAGAGTLDVWSSGPALEAIALDGRGLSYVHVADGKIDRDRLRRTSFLRGVLRAGTKPYLVWAMPDSRCDDREDHCAGRPTGLSAYERGAAALGEPTWKLGGHPAGRIDRVIQISELGRVDLIARVTAAGGLELLSFRLPEGNQEIAEHKTSMLEPTTYFPVRAEGGPASIVLLPGEPNAVLYASDTDEGVLPTLAWAIDNAKPLPLMAAKGKGPWTLGCSLGESRYLIYGSTNQLRVLRTDGPTHAPESLLVQDVALRAPIDADNPALDEVRLLCDAGRVHVLLVNAAHALQQISCDAQACNPLQNIASDVASYAAVTDGDGLVVAYAAPLQGPVVRVVRLGHDDKPDAPAITPAACWDPLGGMCGAPTLVRDAQRLVLAARDGADLLALESTDHAHSFASLSGLVVSGSFESSTTSPLQQHRIRKGLE